MHSQNGHTLVKHNMGNVFAMLGQIKALSVQCDEESHVLIAEIVDNIKKHLLTVMGQCPAAKDCPGIKSLAPA